MRDRIRRAWLKLQFWGLFLDGLFWVVLAAAATHPAWWLNRFSRWALGKSIRCAIAAQVVCGTASGRMEPIEVKVVPERPDQREAMLAAQYGELTEEEQMLHLRALVSAAARKE